MTKPLRNKLSATTVMLVASLLVAMSCGGCAMTPYKGIATAQTTLNKFARFVEVFDRVVASYVKAEDHRCTDASASGGTLDSEKYSECIRPALQFSVAWTGEWKGKKTGKGALPAIQDAQRATRYGLDAALDYVQANESACGKKSGAAAEACKKRIAAWRKLLKPAICGLVPIIDRGIKLGAFKASQDPTYVMIKGLADSLCK